MIQSLADEFNASRAQLDTEINQIKNELVTNDITKRQLEADKRKIRAKSEIKMNEDETFMSHETKLMKQNFITLQNQIEMMTKDNK